tara:strand:+ start:3212 stop:4300 length:1089 start_codon:yes stop_codon:yes gene_type:complete
MVYLTDPDNEIDDQVLMRIVLKNDILHQDVWFVCVPGFTTPDAPACSPREQSEHRVQCVREQFPDEFGITSSYRATPHPNSSVFHLTTWHYFEQILAKTAQIHDAFVVDTLIQVAPLITIYPKSFKLMTIQTRIVMGDISNPSNSMNLTKTMDKTTHTGRMLLNLYIQQEEILNKNSKKTISIPTQYARQIPIPYALMESLPGTLRIPLLNKAFEQFAGRPDPSMPWAESISVANHSTILKMLPKDKMYDILSQPSEERIITMVINFLNSNTPRDEFYPLRLGQIATAVEYITQVKYNGTGFNKDGFGDSQETAKENWLAYLAKHRPDMSPLYDGIAWVVMQQGRLPSVGESKKILHKSWST